MSFEYRSIISSIKFSTISCQGFEHSQDECRLFALVPYTTWTGSAMPTAAPFGPFMQARRPSFPLSLSLFSLPFYEAAAASLMTSLHRPADSLALMRSHCQTWKLRGFVVLHAHCCLCSVILPCGLCWQHNATRSGNHATETCSIFHLVSQISQRPLSDVVAEGRRKRSMIYRRWWHN